MSLTRGQERLIEIALDRLDSVGSSRPACVYIIDQLVEGGSPEYHDGERPERQDAAALIETLRLHMPGLPKLSEID